MSLEHHWYLKELQPAIQSAKMRIFMESAGLHAQDFIYPDRLKPEQIRNSLRHFAAEENKTGRLLKRLSTQKQKTAPQEVSSDVHLSATSRLDRDSGNSDCLFHDGDFGFALNFEPNRGRIIDAGLDFVLINDLQRELLRYRGLNKDSFRDNDLLVLQMQTSDENAHPAIHDYRWSAVLLGALVDWANTVGFPRVLVQPSAHNYWALNHGTYNVNPPNLPHMYKVYDRTAQSLGFTQAADNEPYVLNLPVGITP